MTSPLANIQPFDPAKILICPLCVQPLQQQEKQLRCSNGHSFDRAKQGYVNLLPVQHKRSKAPGDDKAMVQARQQFLDQGYYQPLAETLTRLVSEIRQPHTTGTLLDAGCGEGYYSNFIQQRLPQLSMYGIDISKPAIAAACKRSREITWLVASLKSIPLAANSLDLILSVFSPIQSQAFRTGLKEHGTLLVVTAGKQHLANLKAHLYEQVVPFEEEKILPQLADHWHLTGQHKVTYEMQLNCQSAIQSLLAMTPHTWRISPARKARLNTLNHLSCEADFLITQWRKKTDE